ncbi:hypothetical protein CGSSp4595_2148 [Streptococcus pneumoniae 459-5]|nr:hypothetical protein SPAR82_2236 [Streptococcus pneumoniae GA44378]EHD77420.1 hypothetical protein SPAR144_2173 [Streptococcus pneumoniae NP170]EHE20841.1 hypothetical protein SPAR73_2260 [Streptococcus pneumoniae GA41565]EHE75160.1 hypothetical protein SPAR24_2199 [Streptococcus pneumoniae GA11663]EHZ14388.1 hypothetical protein SPAR29_2145 [Streptococcus pneumoniae GA13430]EIC53893.1 hypothetical protein CGSSp4595_2148 [Streptococcus pneumoniae 459-5]
MINILYFLIILTIWQVFDEFSEKYDKMKKIESSIMKLATLP